MTWLKDYRSVELAVNINYPKSLKTYSMGTDVLEVSEWEYIADTSIISPSFLMTKHWSSKVHIPGTIQEASEAPVITMVLSPWQWLVWAWA